MDQVTKFTAVGRKKESVARVRLIPGTGTITVNARPLDAYFIRETDQIVIKQPLIATNNVAKYDIFANIRGGGTSGQAGALRHGISRALAQIEQAYKEILRKQGFLTRDPRAKERKKYGQKGARKRFQWTKR